MRWSAVDVEVVLLDILTMVAFAVGQTEQAFLQDRIALVPKRNGKAETLLVVGDSSQTILAPLIGA
jgi:hypothetical protein